MFLMQYCEYKIKQDVYLIHKERMIFEGKWDGSPEIFKVVFHDQQVVNIEKMNNLCFDS